MVSSSVSNIDRFLTVRKEKFDFFDISMSCLLKMQNMWALAKLANETGWECLALIAGQTRRGNKSVHGGQKERHERMLAVPT
jgi:hypothetical protein